MTVALGSEGFDVTVANDGQAALEALSGKPQIDAIVLKRTTPGRVTSFHFNDGSDQFFGRSLRTKADVRARTKTACGTFVSSQTPIGITITRFSLFVHQRLGAG
jgi:CheY-like chemotaxis protein